MEISKKDSEDPNDQSESNLLMLESLTSALFSENISTSEVKEDNSVQLQQIQTPTLEAEQHQTPRSTVIQQNFQQLPMQQDQNLHSNTMQAQQQFQKMHFDQGSQSNRQQERPHSSSQFKHQNEQSVQKHWENEVNLEEEKQKVLQEIQTLYVHNKHNTIPTQLESQSSIVNLPDQTNRQGLLQSQQLHFQQNRQMHQNSQFLQTEQPYHNRQLYQNVRPLYNVQSQQGNSWETQKQLAMQQFQQLELNQYMQHQHYTSGYHQGTQHFHEPDNHHQFQQQLKIQQIREQEHNYRMHLLRESGYPLQHQLPQYYLHRPQLLNVNVHPSQLQSTSQRVITDAHTMVQVPSKRKPKKQPVSRSEQPSMNKQHSPLQLPIVNRGSSQIAQKSPRLSITPQSQISEHTSEILHIPNTNELSELTRLPTINADSSLVNTFQFKDQMPKVIKPLQVPIDDGTPPLDVHPLQVPITNCKKLQVVHPTRMSIKDGQRTYMMPVRQLPLVHRAPMTYQPQMFIPNPRFQPIAGPSHLYQPPPNQGMQFYNDGYNLPRDLNMEPQQKRSRFHNEEQTLELEKTFYATDSPSKVDINKLSINIGLSEQQIESWFQYRRMKQKKDDETNFKEKTEQVINWLSEIRNHDDIETYYGIDGDVNEDTKELPDSSSSKEPKSNT
ncbi:unnamed protein product [Psylliodes chrysocephalus]|uniref:Homeobox domain-containing protein n=1 Tax=Psylliodes chrysocephalus TaxID=3402493 RepID=A0A9P0DE17_9CUCU|nr:unnamed protein product [Psylliodes chrysocephala]